MISKGKKKEDISFKRNGKIFHGLNSSEGKSKPMRAEKLPPLHNQLCGLVTSSCCPDIVARFGMTNAWGQ